MKVHFLWCVLFISHTFAVTHHNIKAPNVNAELYIGKGNNQPLIVGFGGGEGGNAWASDYWKSTRDKFVKQGYAMLAIGYFGMKGTPEKLDRVSLNDIFYAIQKASKHHQIDGKKIALIGGSKGAELALNLAARYDEIGAVVAIVPSHVSFPALTMTMGHSSWVYNGGEIPYMPANERVIKPALKGDLHSVFSIILENAEMEKKAVIPVEDINGPIFIMSAKNDEMWPSYEMSEKIVNRLRVHNFNHFYEHHVSAGGHGSPLKSFDKIFAFLDKNFKNTKCFFTS